MTGEFHTNCLSATAARCKGATDWLAALTIRWEVTRFRRYIDLAVRFSEGSAAARNSLLAQDGVAIYNAVSELGDLLDIYHALAGKYDDQVRDRLYAYVGADGYSADTPGASTRRARDLGAELRLLARMVRAGVIPDFSFGGTAAGRFGSRTMVFQCKRPEDPSRMMPCFNEAVEQLQGVFATIIRPRMKGVITIDSSSLVNPELRLPQYERPDDLARQTELRMHSLLGAFSQHWHKAAHDRLVAVLVSQRDVAVVPSRDGPDPYTCESMMLAELPACSMLDSSVLREMLACFESRHGDVAAEPHNPSCAA